MAQRNVDIDIIIWNTPEWTAIPDWTFQVGDSVDIDLYNYLNVITATITRKVGTDQLPPDLSIVNNRYLRGEVTEASNRDITLVATRYSVSVDSPEFNITVESITLEVGVIGTQIGVVGTKVGGLE